MHKQEAMQAIESVKARARDLEEEIINIEYDLRTDLQDDIKALKDEVSNLQAVNSSFAYQNNVLNGKLSRSPYGGLMQQIEDKQRGIEFRDGRIRDLEMQLMELLHQDKVPSYPAIIDESADEIRELKKRIQSVKDFVKPVASGVPSTAMMKITTLLDGTSE